MESAFAVDQGRSRVAPAGWVGQGRSLDGRRINLLSGIFPQACLDGVWEGTGGDEQAGVGWERRRKQLQRLGDCCLRVCADMWGMACFLWTASDRPEPRRDRSKRGREWARQAEKLLAANPGLLVRDITIYKMGMRSKRNSVYVQGVRATWTASQWWVEMKKEEEFWSARTREGKRWGRSGQG